MIKIMALIPRKPGLSREDFIKYYETKHVPLILSYFPQIIKYIRNYPSKDENFHYEGNKISPGVPYDAVTEIWLKDQASYNEMMQMFMDDPSKFNGLVEDEKNFIDIARSVEYLAEERESEIKR
jgi:hypothetical protein